MQSKRKLCECYTRYFLSFFFLTSILIFVFLFNWISARVSITVSSLTSLDDLFVRYFSIFLRIGSRRERCTPLKYEFKIRKISHVFSHVYFILCNKYFYQGNISTGINAVRGGFAFEICFWHRTFPFLPCYCLLIFRWMNREKESGLFQSRVKEIIFILQ